MIRHPLAPAWAAHRPRSFLWRELCTLTAYSLICALLGGVAGYGGALLAHRPMPPMIVMGWVAPACGPIQEALDEGVAP